MRIPLVLFLLPLIAACAARGPLDLIPREELMLIEAAEKLEAKSPAAVPPAPPRDIDAEFAAALMAAGIPPDAPAPAPTGPAPAPTAPGPISVQDMLARVRAAQTPDPKPTAPKASP